MKITLLSLSRSSKNKPIKLSRQEFNRLSPTAQEAYLKDFPDSKFVVNVPITPLAKTIAAKKLVRELEYDVKEALTAYEEAKLLRRTEPLRLENALEELEEKYSTFPTAQLKKRIRFIEDKLDSGIFDANVRQAKKELDDLANKLKLARKELTLLQVKH